MPTVTSRGSIQATLSGRGLVTLRPSDHIATGGEGSIYRIGKDTVAKIFSNPKEMQRLGMPDKIRELKVLRSPYVVSPIDLILSENHEPIGYYMSYVEGHPLSRVFTNDFWNQEGFEYKHARELADRMRETVTFAHAHKAVLVDANELNWLVKFKGANPEPRVVDVDSWSIGKWPAKVIMPSIRDWSAKVFDERSDWFSWGVVTFQLFTGLHPYKGTHPSFKKTELVERMKANASVFAPDVRLNLAVRDFSNIPKPLLEWYKATFEKGERTIPPSPLATSIAGAPVATTLKARTIGKSAVLVFDKLYDPNGEKIIRLFRSGAILLDSGRLLDARTRQEIARKVSRDCEVMQTLDGWLILEKRDGKAVLTFSEKGGMEEKLAFSIEAKGIFSFENRLFVLGEAGLTEVKLHRFGEKTVVSAGQTWGTLPNSTRLFDGLGVQDAMGAMFAVLPNGGLGLSQVRVRELDGMRVLSGKAGPRFASVVAVDPTGSYQRVDFYFSKDYTTYSVKVSQVDQASLNMAILPKGVVVTIIDDEELLISVPSSGVMNTVTDKLISTDMLLGNFDDQVVYIENGCVWTLKVK